MFLSVIVLAIAIPVMAGEPTEQIKQTTDKILGILTNPNLTGPAKDQERRKLILEAVKDRFDWERMSRSVLATHWAKRTAEERREFTDLFARLVENTYMTKVEGYSGEKIYYDTESVDGEYAIVGIRIMTKTGTEIPVKYRLINEGHNWLVYDVLVEGVSLVNNYRAQISNILTTSSFSQLMEKLKAKVGER
jgi:phospholipid transport system substrate-binding protein